MRKLFLFILILFAANFSLHAQSYVKTVSGDLYGVHHWSADTIYVLMSNVYVKSGAVLNIEAGTIIKGDNASYGKLIVVRGAKIYAIGEPHRPIVFTSLLQPFNRFYSDWGGLFIFGNARVNLPGGIGSLNYQLMTATSDSSDHLYGGMDDNDSSGELRYVRIEYGGGYIMPNIENAGLTLGGVGRGTKISYVQTSYNLNGFNWLGGTVNCNHLISFRSGQISYSARLGYTGKVQFAIAFLDSLSSNIGKGSLWLSNDGNVNLPKTNPTFSNITLVGQDQGSPCAEKGLMIQSNGEVKLFNSVILASPVGIECDTHYTSNLLAGRIVIKNTVVSGSIIPLDPIYIYPSPLGVSLESWYLTPSFNNEIYNTNSALMLTDPFNYTALSVKPLPNSPLLNGASFADSNLTGFDQVGFRGAMGNVDWTNHWVEYDPDAQVYDQGFLPTSIENTTLCKPELHVYPNPAQHQVALAITLPEAQAIHVKIRNLQGQELRRQTLSANKGVQHIVLETQTLANGFYLVEITGTTWQQTLKLNVAH